MLSEDHTLNKLNRAIDRFCILHPNFGIPNLMLYIAIANVVVGLFCNLSPAGAGLVSLFTYSINGVLHGQIWRLVTFVFIPLDTSPFFLLLTSYFYYWIGSTLERQWGTAKFTIYYFSGVALTVIGFTLSCLLMGNPYLSIGSTYYINLAMFFAFAVLYPEARVLLFFFIPVRMKILAIIDACLFAYDIFAYIARGNFAGAILPVVALLNFVIFFWPEFLAFLKLENRRSKQAAHFHNTVRTQQRVEETQQQSQGFHRRCCVCGRTDASNPELEFRYCSKCAGYHCFCSDHLFSHIHFTDEQP